MIDLKLFQQFIAVAEEASFRKAAERLHISQPPLSAAIQKLEASIGARLLDRTRQYVRLTAAGEAFLDEARRTLVQAAMALEVARGAAEGRHGTLRLAFLPSTALVIVPSLLRAFRDAYPKVHLLLSSGNSGIQLERLKAGRIDVGIMVVPVHQTGGLRIQQLMLDSLVLAVPAAHPLAGRKRVKLGELAGESFVGFPFLQSPGYAGIMIAACQRAGFFPRIVQEAAEMQTILAIVAGGDNVALVPEDMRRIEVQGVSFVSVTHAGGPIRYSIGMVAADEVQNAVVNSMFSIARRVSMSHARRRVSAES